MSHTLHDEQSLADAVHAALTTPVPRLAVRERVRQRVVVAREHDDVHHQVLADR